MGHPGDRPPLRTLHRRRHRGRVPARSVASATFWTALWGPIGLILATPLTVCLVVLGRHVERLEFLDVMFGDRPALSPPEIFYQRMLAGDPTEAAEKAEQFLKERSLASYYDEVALKGLQLAQVDAERGALDQERSQRFETPSANLPATFPIKMTGRRRKSIQPPMQRPRPR